MITKLLTDADGVIINSRDEAWLNAHKLVSLFKDLDPFLCIDDYKEHFGRSAQHKLVGELESETLRSMHRLLMRHSANKIRCFDEVLALYRKLTVPITVISSAMAGGISTILSEKTEFFQKIYGRESGRKIDILKANYTGSEIYVTDSIRDIRACQSVGMDVIAVGWGYDDFEKLKMEKPSFFVLNPKELEILFRKLSLIN